MDILKILEKQSGFLRVLNYLVDNGEQPITKLISETGIPIHQVYSSIELGEKWKMITSRKDDSSHPIKNMIGITEKGVRATQKLRELMEIVLEN